jgi:hypothetical protein
MTEHCCSEVVNLEAMRARYLKFATCDRPAVCDRRSRPAKLATAETQQLADRDHKLEFALYRLSSALGILDQTLFALEPFSGARVTDKVWCAWKMRLSNGRLSLAAPAISWWVGIW